jgi:hypothetical protein
MQSQHRGVPRSPLYELNQKPQSPARQRPRPRPTQSSSSRHSSQSPLTQNGSNPPHCDASRHSTQRPRARSQRRASPEPQSASLRQLGHTGYASLQPGSGSQPLQVAAMHGPVSQLGASQPPASASQLSIVIGPHMPPSQSVSAPGDCGAQTPPSHGSSGQSTPLHGAAGHWPPSQLATGQLSLVHTGGHTPPGHGSGHAGPGMPAAQRNALHSASLHKSASQRCSVHGVGCSQLPSRHAPEGGQFSPTHS